jgi:hypothetical protein
VLPETGRQQRPIAIAVAQLVLLRHELRLANRLHGARRAHGLHTSPSVERTDHRRSRL